MAGTELELIISNNFGDILAFNTGTMTPDGQVAMKNAVKALDGVKLKELYGCPDCADGGASSVTLVRDGVISSHVYEYGAPPAALAAVDSFVTTLMEPLKTCADGIYALVDADCVSPF